MNFRESEVAVLDSEPSKLESFFADHQEALEEMRAQFLSDDFNTFKTLSAAITKLHNLYNSETGDTSGKITKDILHRIIDESYVNDKEDSLKSLDEHNGFYKPSDEAGGGDFWQKREHHGSVGEVLADAELMDMMGHGADSMYLKALALRFFEVYRIQPQEDQQTIFADLDAFLFEMPDLYTLDYIEARIVHDKEGMMLEVEIAGSGVLFLRDNETGMIYQRLPPGKDYGGEAVRDVLTPLENIDEHTVIGAGVTKDAGPKVNRIPLPPNVDVYILSDGLFELPVDNPENRGSSPFEKHFAEFCRELKGATGDEFRKALMKKAEELRTKYTEYLDSKPTIEGQKKETVDDITVLVLHVADGKVN